MLGSGPGCGAEAEETPRLTRSTDEPAKGRHDLQSQDGSFVTSEARSKRERAEVPDLQAGSVSEVLERETFRARNKPPASLPRRPCHGLT